MQIFQTQLYSAKKILYLMLSRGISLKEFYVQIKLLELELLLFLGDYMALWFLNCLRFGHFWLEWSTLLF